jgi:2-keto-4-pentenoate hydratase/2-oxohepta-3-ene-1,7-dioic acid hydratase in catechol pathway
LEDGDGSAQRRVQPHDNEAYAAGTFVRGAFDWVTSLGPGGIISAIVERTIRDDRASGGYLQPGDVVTITADQLGTLENRVE